MEPTRFKHIDQPLDVSERLAGLGLAILIALAGAAVFWRFVTYRYGVNGLGIDAINTATCLVVIGACGWAFYIVAAGIAEDYRHFCSRR